MNLNCKIEINKSWTLKCYPLYDTLYFISSCFLVNIFTEILEILKITCVENFNKLLKISKDYSDLYKF